MRTRSPQTPRSPRSAAACGREAWIRKLLELGADVEAQDYYGVTPLHEAATVANPLDYTAMIWGEVDTLRDRTEQVGDGHEWLDAGDRDPREAAIEARRVCRTDADRARTPP